MTITLEQELIVTSDKTINARGANLEIFNGPSITVQFAKNVIIHGLQIHHINLAKDGKINDDENHHGLWGASDGDGVSRFGATNVWLDHLSLHHCAGGLIDVTVALNHFSKGLVERMPRCRFGFIHVINNNYNHWFLYTIGSTSHPTIISQGNRYSAPGTFGAKEVTCRGFLKPAQWKNWNWVPQGEYF
ncbi:hypothetical protein Gogos_009059 [Gossypium gossypioides]|uniref:Pectate lyase n=1 Tax=Gossypium gossypioides TaxID=34282 RepID=A0A7J9CDM2_GOSGO|nr:hypothetical protein [Gossypium gossypioides]